MALLNLLLLPILAALGLFTPGAGEGGGDPPADPPKDPPADPPKNGPKDPPVPKPGDLPADPPAPAPQAGTSLEDVAKLQRELNEARAQAGQYRTAGIQAIASALGLELPKIKGEEGQEAAITQLQTEITSLRTENRTNAIEAGLERTFSALGAKPMLTRRYIADQLKDLDPKTDDFTDKLKAIVQAAIDEEPALKATQAAPRSGGEFTGDGGGDNDLESKSIDELRKMRTEQRTGASVH